MLKGRVPLFNNGTSLEFDGLFNVDAYSTSPNFILVVKGLNVLRDSDVLEQKAITHCDDVKCVMFDC